MGTRSLIHFKEDGESFCVVFRQFDGYPEGRGKELAEWLSNISVVNGLAFGAEKVANGVGCLAAQWIKHEKGGPGGVYMVPITAEWEEYTYDVDVNFNTRQVTMRCFDGATKIFEGPAKDFAEFLNQQEA
jgi:hypothetical protein